MVESVSMALTVGFGLLVGVDVVDVGGVGIVESGMTLIGSVVLGLELVGVLEDAIFGEFR